MWQNHSKNHKSRSNRSTLNFKFVLVLCRVLNAMQQYFTPFSSKPVYVSITSITAAGAWYAGLYIAHVDINIVKKKQRERVIEPFRLFSRKQICMFPQTVKKSVYTLKTHVNTLALLLNKQIRFNVFTKYTVCWITITDSHITFCE